MSLYMHVESKRASGCLRRALTLATYIGLAIWASSSPTPAAGATPTLSTQATDSEQHDRQFQRAEALYLSGRLKEAASAFEQLTRAYPRDGRVWLKYGNTLTKQGSYDEAAVAFQTAISVDSEQGGPALNLALVRLAQAQAALATALQRLPADSTEHLQATSLQQQIKQLLGTPESGASPH
jgi:tetratricopeptide (TPR) repeat protein